METYQYLISVAWLALAYINAGFLLAKVQGDHAYDPDFNRCWYRTDLGFAVGLSLIPPTWILTPFLTGFYEHGWMRPQLKFPE